MKICVDLRKYQIIFDNNIQMLNAIINWCESHKIRVILFTPPAYEAYRNSLNPIQLQTTIITSENLAKKYKNCTYYNLISDSSFVATDFFDADHLSDIGAKKLSGLINNMIIEWK